MLKEEFGKRIKQLREENGLSMQALANALEVTKSAVNMWENGGAVPREDILIKISKQFKISIDELLGNKNVDNSTLAYIQRGLSKMDDEKLKTVETILKAAFKDIYESEEEDDEI